MKKTTFHAFKNIHCIGIGGIGLSGLASVLKKQGFRVSGSDQQDSPIVRALQKRGIPVSIRQAPDSLPAHTDLAIYSTAVPKNNPERVLASKMNIKQINYFYGLELLRRESDYTLAIAGTKGKTTTTAMTSSIFSNAGLKPTVIVGSLFPQTKKNYQIGEKTFCIVEACEYKNNFKYLHPTDIAITNLYMEHPDYFHTMAHMRKIYENFIKNINSSEGVLALNKSDSESKKIKSSANIITFSANDKKADLYGKNIRISGKRNIFTLCDNIRNQQCDIELHVPGIFNISNALAACALAVAHDIDLHHIKNGLESFRGMWRRFELLPKYKGAHIISDYAHHPEAVSATIRAAKELYPKKRILVIFQPHQYSRTKKLYSKFVDSLIDADITILPEIYFVKGREKKEDQNISSNDLSRSLQKKNKASYYAADFRETKNILLSVLKKNDVVVCMGAGDIFQFAESLR